MEHIAILSHRSVLEKILSGKKTIESRFSRLKSLPFGQVGECDVIYFKLSGGPIMGKAQVAKVEEYENLTPGLVSGLAKRYQSELAISEDFLVRKLESRFATLIFLKQVEQCEPWGYKQEGRAGWIVLPPGTELPQAQQVEIAKMEDFRAIRLK
ncbi:MAG: ASCH domain-containing protein [Chloroflexota bacterium]